MARQQNLDIGHLEAERLDRFLNQGNRAVKAAIDENMPLGSRYEIGGQILGADVVNVADDLVRVEWRVPLEGALSNGGQGQRQRGEKHGRDLHRWAANHFFSALPRNSNNALVAGSLGKPRSALILLWVVSLAPKTVTGTPAPFSTFPKRCACALVSGCSVTCRIRNGGIPLFLATCVTAEKSRCFAASFPNFSR